MKLSKVLPSVFGNRDGTSDAEVGNLHIFPQFIEEGDLFISLPSKDKNTQLKKLNYAIQKGAKVLLIQEGVSFSTSENVKIFNSKNIWKAVSEACSHLEPNQPENILGITGTCGKTSTAHFFSQLFSNLGVKASCLGSLQSTTEDGKKIILNLDPVSSGKTRYLYGYINRLAENEISHLALELSSSVLDRCRADHVSLKGAVFTNLSYEHLNYHKSMENYFLAKERLFSELLPEGALSFVNIEDSYGKRIYQTSKRRKHQVTTFGDIKGDICIKESIRTDKGLEVKVSYFGRVINFHFPISVKFQLINFLPILGYALNEGFSESSILKAIEEIRMPPGRWELVRTFPNKARVYLDFAHKPGALEAILTSARNETGKSLVSLVIGCDGGADPKKLPQMGDIANRLADKVIVTDDNPRKANAAYIREKLMDKCPHALEIPNRKEAIEYALNDLAPGEICVIVAKLAVFDTSIPGNRPYFAEEEREIIKKWSGAV